MRIFNNYYSGDHPWPFLTDAHKDKIHSEFRNLLHDSKTNFTRLVVDVCEERLQVEGFRLSASTDEETDKGAWDIWQQNQMDSESQVAFTEALIKGVSYLAVWKDAGADHPSIAVEDPLETVVAYRPGTNYRVRDAAVKIWCDSANGVKRANVFMPEGIYKFQAPEKGEGSTDKPQWKQLPGDDFFVNNPLGVVPIVPLRNRPRLLCEGESELTDITWIQNRINGLVFLLCLAGYFGAHRQRWLAGVKIMKDASGRPVKPFDDAVDRLWQSENPEAKFGEFSQTDLGGYIKAIEQSVLQIAVTTRTPRHYLIEQGQSPSGDAIKSAESGLVKKVERKQRPFGEGLEEAIRLARRFAGEKDSPPDSEIVWADASTPTVAQVTDAVIKQHAEGLIDQATALEKLGYSQTEIRRIMSQKTQDALIAALTPPPPVVVPPPTNGNVPQPVIA